MVKLEFENPPPTKEALEQSQAAAVERVSRKKRKKKPSPEPTVGDGSFEPLPVSESDPTKAVSTIQTPSQPQTVVEQQQAQQQAIEQQVRAGQQARQQSLDLAAQSRAAAIEQSFQPLRIDPVIIPPAIETTRRDLGFTGLDPVELRQAGFEPIFPPSEVQPSIERLPSKKFVEVREKLRPQLDTAPITFQELPIAAGIVVGEAGVQATELLRGAIVDPIQAIVNPAQSLQPVFETGVALATGETTPGKVGQEISEAFIAEPARFAGNVAFDIVSGKAFVGARTKAISELGEFRRTREFKAMVTDPEFKLPPTKTQVVSGVDLPEGLTLADDVPRRELLTVSEEFSEGLLPVLDEPTGTVKELQAQLIADPSVKVTAEGLPVDIFKPQLDTAGLLERQLEINSIKIVDEDFRKTFFDKERLGTVRGEGGIDPFMDAPTPQKQTTLDKSFAPTKDSFVLKIEPDLGKVDAFVEAPKTPKTPPPLREAVDLTKDIKFPTDTTKIDFKPTDISGDVKVKSTRKLLATPDPVSALFQTAVDPEFISFASKEFERLKRGTKKFQADVEVPPSRLRKAPDFEYPLTATTFGREPTIEEIAASSFDVRSISDLEVSPAIETAQQPVVSIDQARGLTPENIQIISVTPVTEPDVIIDTKQRRKSRSSQEVIIGQEITPDQDIGSIVIPPIVTQPRPIPPIFRPPTPRPPTRIVPKPRPRPKQKLKPKQTRFTIIIGTKGAKTFKTIEAGSLVEAARIGKRSVLGTAAASLEILPVGRGLRVEEEEFIEDFLGGRFRRSKARTKKFVQKREFRISSPGEKREITFRGLASLRTSKGTKNAIDLISKGVPLRNVRKLL